MLTSLNTQVFRSLTRLQYLRLGSNRLSMLTPGTFAPLVALVQLHLEDNQIPTAPSLTLPLLTHLFLHRNLLTELRRGVFDGLTAIQELHLQLNADLRLIEPGALNSTVSATATPGAGLRMEGSRSSCTVGLANVVSCQCAEGYAPPSGRTDACISVDCGLNIGGIDVNAVYVSPCLDHSYELIGRWVRAPAYMH